MGPPGGGGAGEEVPHILRLDETVVNRIAAGEVIQRPANAVKELVENSLDAGARCITVTAKDGGLKLLQIQDDGHGIRMEDFGILCERFTTSKLRKYEDLSQISSFGFRGEALASITHAARVTITSKTRSSPYAYRARYSDGKMLAVKPGEPAKPEPCAGVDGTIITVEDLFYNMHTRRAAFKNTNEQYRAILSVLTRYAVQYGKDGVSFTCKKLGRMGVDLHTPRNGTVQGNIRVIFGQQLARELLEFSCEYPPPDHDQDKMQEDDGGEQGEGKRDNEGEEGEEEEEGGGLRRLKFRATGYISNANYSMKTGTFMLFINNRLVESSAIKKVIDGVYANILPNNTHPFVYLSLEMPPEHLDVNVHPTKREVQFLFESLLLEKLTEAFERRLEGSNSSRVFYGESMAAGLVSPIALADKTLKSSIEESKKSNDQAGLRFDEEGEEEEGESKENTAKASSKSKAAAPPKYAHKMVRTDASMGDLRAFLYTKDAQSAAPSSEEHVPLSKALLEEDVPLPSSQESGGGQASTSQHDVAQRKYRRRLPTITETKCQYHSIRALLATIQDQTHPTLLALLKRHTFVGIVDTCFSLIQHSTQLLLVRHVELCKELFYQLAIRRFGCMPRLSLVDNPVPVRDFIRAALDLAEVKWTEEHGPKDELADNATALLVDKIDMLDEYFRIGFDDHARLVSLPDLLPGYLPSPEALPVFLLRLATEVSWGEEQACFESVALELSLFYSDLSAYEGEPEDPTARDSESDRGPVSKNYECVLKDVLYPAFRSLLFPPRDLAQDGTITQVASLEQLYKVFERC